MIYLNPPTEGPAPAPPPLPPLPAATGSPALAIVSLTSAILGIFLLAAFLGPLAVITGAVGLSGNRPSRGVAVAGLLVGIVVALAGVYNINHAVDTYYSTYSYSYSY